MIKLTCSPQVSDMLIQALKDYAYAAFPEGPSECAAASRAGLIDIADRMAAGYAETGESMQISSRARAQLKAAIKFWCQCHGRPEAEDTLLGLLKGKTLDELP